MTDTYSENAGGEKLLFLFGNGADPEQFAASCSINTSSKLDIASACHAHGKVPSHCVVTEFSDTAAMQLAARHAARELGYARMWSIHPAQIRPILEAFAPTEGEIDDATKIIAAAAHADWAPTSFDGKLHDRASYRYFWQVLERANRTGRPLPPEAQSYFPATAH